MKGRKYFIGLCLGLAVGAGLAYLFRKGRLDLDADDFDAYDWDEDDWDGWNDEAVGNDNDEFSTPPDVVTASVDDNLTDTEYDVR